LFSSKYFGGPMEEKKLPKGRSSKTKGYSRRRGHAYERTVANIFKEIFPNAKRHLEYQASEAQGFDLDGTGNLLIQCKRYAKYVNPSKIEEVKKANKDQIPVLVTQGDYKKSVAVLYLDDFIRILKDVGEAYYNENESYVEKEREIKLACQKD